jgi:hypothetical protein
MKQVFILLAGILISTISLSQGFKFSCPLKKARIEVHHYSTEVSLKPGSTFQSNYLTVHNISEGIVKAIDTSFGLINVYVESGDFYFSYHNFKDVVVHKGEKLLQGQQIGKLKEKLFLIMSLKNELVDPLNYLKCKTKNVWL